MTDRAALADRTAPDPALAGLSFPRLRARTARFTLGEPRAFAVSPDGARVVFLRSASGTDRAHALWVLDVASGEELCVADPASLLSEAEELTPQERARRERSREQGAGVVGYATDRAVARACFALSGRVFVVDLAGEPAPRELPTAGGAIDPRLDPTGRLVAYVSDGSLRVVGVDAGSDGGSGASADRVLAAPDEPTEVWGLAEFVAAEEMGRSRGSWWAPDGGSLLVERFDEAPVQVWHIADPANPDRPPVPHRYPAAGTANADVTLWHVALDGTRREVVWDTDALPYLAAVSWPSAGGPLLLVQSRNQRRTLLLTCDPASLDDGPLPTTLVLEQTDPDWVELVAGAPARLPDGRVVTTVDEDDTRKVAVDGEAISPVGLHVRAVLDVEADGVLVSASREPQDVEVVKVGLDGATTFLSDRPGAGVRTARSSGGTTVLASRSPREPGLRVQVLRDGLPTRSIASLAVRPPLEPRVWAGVDVRGGLTYRLLLPRDHVAGTPLPVLVDPYGGPGAQRVVASSAAFLEAQWLADQGFGVVVADGRGTPGRSPSWEKAIAGDLASVVLEDQVSALHAAAAEHPDLDLTRVGIRGWSFGGYLAALAVLRRPDVFHAAVAGAPVTDWRLYDTHYTERYLGDPARDEAAYAQSSLLADAASLRRPLLLVHGLADDNVVVAHTLRLSQALLEGGRPHQVLPLSGVTHMTPQEVVAEHLLLLQVEFLQGALGVGRPDAATG